ncbi:MAG: zinc-binding dehydrogenase [SAR202 cluster bacterium]|nr:zinc-binding dehydrogenase [SAR202 cluster bacterium]|tara:strand:- start:1536 stop:2567 length:1032 start_codon:yes stop_codon:yes gene_type:complete
MRGVAFHGNSIAEVIDYPDTDPGPEQVLVKLRSSGLCGSDFVRYDADSANKHSGQMIRPGHEPCGEIAAVGNKVKGVKIGDRIIQHHYEGCRECNYCLTGWQQLCEATDKKRYYGGSMHGGHGDYMVAHQSTCVPLPDQVSFEVGAYLACGASTAFQALKKMEISGRDTLAIFGQGPVGLAATMFGQEMGARIIAVDISQERLDMAVKAGAWETVNPKDGNAADQIKSLTKGQGADATLEAAGLSDTRIAAVESTRIFGRACLVGEGGEVTYKPTPHIIHRHLTLIGSWTFSTFGLAEAARFTGDRDIPLSSLITSRSTIEEAPQAYLAFSSGAPGKFVINWD